MASDLPASDLVWRLARSPLTRESLADVYALPSFVELVQANVMLDASERLDARARAARGGDGG